MKDKRGSQFDSRLGKILAIIFALLVWEVVALIVKAEYLVASPINVLVALARLAATKAFWKTIGYSAIRIIGGFLIALVLGVLLSMLANRFRFIEYMLWPFMITIKSVPVASFIIIALIWLSSAKLSIFISFLMVLPIIYTNMLSGLKNVEKEMLEMAEVFKMPWKNRMILIDIPSVKPFFLSATSVALGLAWKAGVAAEVIGIPTGSIGEMLYQAKLYLETADLLAWTVMIVIISVAFEKLFMLLTRKAFARLERTGGAA